MPATRKYTSRRRKPAYRKRRLPMRRYPRQNPYMPKKFTETCYLQDIISPVSTASPNGYVLNVKLNDLINPTALASVYQQYAITGVKLTYIPKYNTSRIDADEGIEIPTMFYAENKINNSVPATAVELMQEDNVKLLRPYSRFSTYIAKPKPILNQIDAQNSTTQVTVQTGTKWLTWLPMTEFGANISHQAARIVVPANNSGSAFTLGTWYAKIYYLMKEQH